jgi:hypothetical protein
MQFTTARERHTCEVPVYCLDMVIEYLDAQSIINLSIARGSTMQYDYTCGRPWSRRRRKDLKRDIESRPPVQPIDDDNSWRSIPQINK